MPCFSHHERTLDVLLSRICFNLDMSLQIWLRVAARFAKWVLVPNRIKYRSQSWIHLVRSVSTVQQKTHIKQLNSTDCIACVDYLENIRHLENAHTIKYAFWSYFVEGMSETCLSIKHLQKDTAIKSDACVLSKRMATIFPAKPKSITNKVLRSKAAAWQCHGRGSRPGVQDQPMCTTWSHHHSWFIA